MKLRIQTTRILMAAALVAVAGIAAPPATALDLQQTPLFLKGTVKPNFILAVDDSGSMGEQRAFPGLNLSWLAWNEENASFFTSPENLYYVDANAPKDPYLQFASYSSLYGDGDVDGGSNYVVGARSIPPFDSFGFARSSDFNKIYFNPAINYTPWRKHDGSSWPEADPAAVHADPRPGPFYAAGYNALFNFIEKSGRQETGDEGFYLLAGMKVPAGTVYRTVENAFQDCGDAGELPKTDGAWSELKSDQLVGNQCKLNMRWFPAVFFLKSPLSLPADFSYVADPLFVPDALGPGGSGLYKYELRPQNFASQLAYDRAIQNFSNWFQYYSNKILALVASITQAFSDIRDVRVGQFNINHLDEVEMYDLSDTLSRAEFYEKITGLQTSAIMYGGSFGTPNRSGVDHLGFQYRRQDPDAPIQSACQVNSGMLFTDGYTNKGNGPVLVGNADGGLGSPFADAFDDTMADIVTSYYEGANTPLREDFEQGKVPIPSSCSSEPAPWVDCNSDLHMRFHAVAFGPQGSIYGVNQPATDDPFSYPPDWNALGSPKGTDGPAVVDELWHSTLNGRGSFVNANTPADITTAIKGAVTATIGTAAVTGGVAASGTRRDKGFLGYLPHFNAEDWTGDLTAHTVGQSNQFDTEIWSAAKKLDEMDVAERNIYFSDTGNELKEFTVANLGGEKEAVERLGLPSATPYGRSVDEVVDYLRGNHSYEIKNPEGTLRDRSTRIGDIFGSRPEILTPAGYGYTGLDKSEGGGTDGAGSYGDFMQTTKKNRTPVAFVGANDGMLHAFDASAGANGGEELFAIIPNAVLGNLGKLPDPAYQHHYFVDGTPVQGDAWDAGAWKTILLVPMGAGGRSIMALDVTDPASSFGPENLLWEFTDPGLGETLGKPHIVLLQDGTWAAVFGSGLRNDHSEHIYIVDLFTGALIAKPTPVPAGPNGAAEDGVVNVAPIDKDYDLKADTIYAPSYDGYLWRFDIAGNGSVTVGNTGKPLIRAITWDNRPQFITGGIDSFPHHIRGQVVFFGTGRYFNASHVAPPFHRQTFYAVWDDPQQQKMLKRADLLQQKITGEEQVAGVEARRVTNLPVDWKTQRGWLLDLAVPGDDASRERSIGFPVVALGRVTFPTFTPALGDSCGAGGTNRLYSLSATSGVGEIPLPGGEGTYASLGIPASAASGPVLTPALVTSPPAPACIPGSPGCPLPAPDPEGGVLVAPGKGCKTPLGVLLGDGLLNFDSITCARQSWQQIQ